MIFFQIKKKIQNEKFIQKIRYIQFIPSYNKAFCGCNRCIVRINRKKLNKTHYRMNKCLCRAVYQMKPIFIAYDLLKILLKASFSLSLCFFSGCLVTDNILARLSCSENTLIKCMVQMQMCVVHTFFKSLNYSYPCVLVLKTNRAVVVILT